MDIDEQHVQFIIAVGDLCAAAARAHLTIEVVTRGGERAYGLAAPVPTAWGEDEVDESGYAHHFVVDDHVLALTDVLGCTIWLLARADDERDDPIGGPPGEP